MSETTSRPCQICDLPITGELYNRGVYYGPLKVGERLPYPGIGYAHCLCLHGLDNKVREAGSDHD
jgi:hypothetical protein